VDIVLIGLFLDLRDAAQILPEKQNMKFETFKNQLKKPKNCKSYQISSEIQKIQKKNSLNSPDLHYQFPVSFRLQFFCRILSD
jgi:hypothetical protein